MAVALELLVELVAEAVVAVVAVVMVLAAKVVVVAPPLLLPLLVLPSRLTRRTSPVWAVNKVSRVLFSLPS